MYKKGFFSKVRKGQSDILQRLEFLLMSLEGSSSVKLPSTSPYSADQVRRQLTGVEKNLAKWREVSCGGPAVEGTCLIPTKMFSIFDEHEHTVERFLKEHTAITGVLDLSTEQSAYAIDEATVGRSVEHIKLSFESKVVPSKRHVEEFNAAIQQHLRKFPDGILAVHCHYGFNRTGFMICSHLCETGAVSPQDAIERFKRARPPGIRHQHFIDELFCRYEDTTAMKQTSI